MNETRQHLKLVSLSIQPCLDHQRGIGCRMSIARIIDGLYDRIDNDAIPRPALNLDK